MCLHSVCSVVDSYIMLSKSDCAIRSPARSHSRKAEVKIAEKLMIIFTKYCVCTLSSQPSCLELGPVEFSFLQIDTSDTYQTIRITDEVRSL